MRINWSLFWTITFAVIDGLSIFALLTCFIHKRSQEIGDERFEKRKRIGFNSDSSETSSEPVPA